MYWFDERKNIRTKKNGPLILRRYFGKWKLISPDTTQQSSPYIEEMWHKVLNQAFAKSEKPMSCLVLGVALGNILTLMAKAFPAAQVTGIDWDGELLALGKKLYGRKYPKKLKLIEGDAGKVVHELKEKFDFIAIDLFMGHDVTPIIADAKFQKRSFELLNPGGIVALNVYDQLKHLKTWDRAGKEVARVQYGTNVVVLYRVE